MNKQAKVAGWIAAAVTFVWFGVHLLVGGADIAGPLRQSELSVELLETLWMVWHMVTAILFATAMLFALAVISADRGMMIAASIVSAALALGGIGAALVSGAGFGVVPQGLLFVPTALLGAWSAVRMT